MRARRCAGSLIGSVRIGQRERWTRARFEVQVGLCRVRGALRSIVAGRVLLLEVFLKQGCFSLLMRLQARDQVQYR